MTDWLCALDDAIVGRLEHCTLCGMRLGGHAWHAIEQVGALAVATLRCTSCYGQDPGGIRLRAVLLRRYAAAASKLEPK